MLIKSYAIHLLLTIAVDLLNMFFNELSLMLASILLALCLAKDVLSYIKLSQFLIFEANELSGLDMASTVSMKVSMVQ